MYVPRAHTPSAKPLVPGHLWPSYLLPLVLLCVLNGPVGGERGHCACVCMWVVGTLSEAVVRLPHTGCTRRCPWWVVSSFRPDFGLSVCGVWVRVGLCGQGCACVGRVGYVCRDVGVLAGTGMCGQGHGQVGRYCMHQNSPQDPQHKKTRPSPPFVWDGSGVRGSEYGCVVRGGVMSAGWVQSDGVG